MSKTSTDWQIEVFFDGDCPLCRKEIGMLRWLDRRKRIRFTNIADPEFRADQYDMTYSQFMDEIQGRLPDGSWVTGVEVFRRLYSAVGLGFIVWGTRLPGISHALDWGYRRFAKNRLKWTGRCSSETCEVQ